MKSKAINLIFTYLMLIGTFSQAADQQVLFIKSDPTRVKILMDSIKANEILIDQKKNALSVPKRTMSAPGHWVDPKDQEKINDLTGDNLKLQDTIKTLEETIKDYKELADVRKERIEELEKSVAKLTKPITTEKK